LNTGQDQCETLDLLRCRTCRLVFATTVSSDPAGMYARDAYDRRRTEVNGGLTAWERWRHDHVIAFHRLAQLKDHIPGPALSRWVDFGCGNGAFLAAARAVGYEVLGVEVDEPFCREVQSLLGVRMMSGADFLDESTTILYPADGLSVLSMFDVLEHLIDPGGVLVQAACSSTATHIVIEVPDLSKHDGSAGDWKHLKPLEHLAHWNPDALDQLRERVLPEFRKRHEAEPVPGRLQVVWSR
jgi:hypothetical protein